MRACPRDVRGQSGIALLAGLVLLAAISLLALVAAGSMSLQRQMAGNFSDSQRARESAGVAVAQAEAVLNGIAHDERNPGCLSDCFNTPLNTVIRQPAELPLHPEFEDASWWYSWASEVGTDPVSGKRLGESWGFGSEPPRFLIEELHFDNLASVKPADAPQLDGIGYYRILGRGAGQGPAAVAVLEAIIARPWLSDPSAEPDTNDNSAFCAPFKTWYDCGRMAGRQLR